MEPTLELARRGSCTALTQWEGQDVWFEQEGDARATGFHQRRFCRLNDGDRRREFRGHVELFRGETRPCRKHLRNIK